ncbi:MAG: tail fiber domain-containing protein [Ferruginibacter sp.]
MKMLFSTLLFFQCFTNAFAQSVAITTDGLAPNSSAMLDIRSTTKGLLIPRLTQVQRNAVTTPATGLMVYQTDNTPGYYYYNGSAWTSLTGSGSGSSSWTANGITVYNTNAGNVGIGTSLPFEKLTVQTTNNSPGISHRGEGGNVIRTQMGGTSAGILFFAICAFSVIVTAIFLASATGNVGIGVDYPAYKLEVAGRVRLKTQSDGNSAGIWFNNIANTTPIAFMGIADNATAGLYGDVSGWGLVMNTNTGNIGIKTLAPANRLQIGSLGSVGFSGNDIAIGNGTNAMAIYQSNTSTTFASSTDIVFMPRNNARGRVGINTATPDYPLEVSDFVLSPSICYAFFARNGPCEENIGGNIGVVETSIYASGRVLASEFDAFSDARIKDMRGTSNGSTDLGIINTIQIRDYTMKDKVKYGDKAFKKVIAQEVEEVYPQVVSKHTGFIPNVYQLTSKISAVPGGFLLSFLSAHHITAGAKKLQLLVEGKKEMQEYDIIDIPSANEVFIRAAEITGDKIFVFGEEVEDFRTVDYEGLATLNISATQELSRLLKMQGKKITEMAATIELLKSRQSLKTVAD